MCQNREATCLWCTSRPSENLPKSMKRYFKARGECFNHLSSASVKNPSSTSTALDRLECFSNHFYYFMSDVVKGNALRIYFLSISVCVWVCVCVCGCGCVCVCVCLCVCVWECERVDWLCLFGGVCEWLLMYSCISADNIRGVFFLFFHDQQKKGKVRGKACVGPLSKNWALVCVHMWGWK